jgi:hypothetical protein
MYKANFFEPNFENTYTDLESMLNDVRQMVPQNHRHCVMFGPGHTVGDACSNIWGTLTLNWRVPRQLEQPETYCQECGSDDIQNGRCRTCGESDMIATSWHTYDENREIYTAHGWLRPGQHVRATGLIGQVDRIWNNDHNNDWLFTIAGYDQEFCPEQLNEIYDAPPELDQNVIKCSCGRIKEERMGAWICPWDGRTSRKQNVIPFSELEPGELFYDICAKCGARPSEKIEPIPREGYQANYLTADGLYGRASFMTAVVRVQ